MKHALKLWIRKRALMALRAILWRADEWLHAQEVQLRKDLAPGAVPATSGLKKGTRPTGKVEATGRGIENFADWEARRSGIAVIPKKHLHRRRRRPTAAEFDRRFA